MCYERTDRQRQNLEIPRVCRARPNNAAIYVAIHYLAIMHAYKECNACVASY